MNVLSIIVSALISAMVTIILGFIIKRPLEKRAEQAEKFAKEERIKQEAVMAGVQAMLRDRLLQGYKHYIEKGWADMDDRANMENVWRQYHALGGNGDMNDLRRTFRHLPMAKDGAPMLINDEELS